MNNSDEFPEIIYPPDNLNLSRLITVREYGTSIGWSGTFNLFPRYTINFALPLSNHDNYHLMGIAALYGFLFILGTCGNAAILAVVHYVRASDIRCRYNNTLTYVMVLCIVDFISMLPLPMTILDQIMGFWMFGTFGCKLFRLTEHIGKIFSTFILVAFSVDRYMAVCHPLKVRSQRWSMRLLFAMFVFACFMLLPICLFAHSKELIIYEKVDTGQKAITKMHLYKCVDDLGDKLFIVFTLYCFTLAYLFPLLAMLFCYYKMLQKLYNKATKVRQSFNSKKIGPIPLNQIFTYTLAICCFHFICWTPYWASVLYSLYVEITDPYNMMESPTPKFIYIMYGIHALPYINSSCNFILYGMFNRQLHQVTTDRRNQYYQPPTSANPQFRVTECSANHQSVAVENVRSPPTVSTGPESSPLLVRVSITSTSVPKETGSQGSTEEAIV